MWHQGHKRLPCLWHSRRGSRPAKGATPGGAGPRGAGCGPASSVGRATGGGRSAAPFVPLRLRSGHGRQVCRVAGSRPRHPEPVRGIAGWWLSWGGGSLLLSACAPAATRPAPGQRVEVSAVDEAGAERWRTEVADAPRPLPGHRDHMVVTGCRAVHVLDATSGRVVLSTDEIADAVGVAGGMVWGGDAGEQDRPGRGVRACRWPVHGGRLHPARWWQPGRVRWLRAHFRGLRRPPGRDAW